MNLQSKSQSLLTRNMIFIKTVLSFLLNKKNRQYILAVVILLVGMYLGTFFAGNKTEYVDRIVTVEHTDTVTVEIPVTIIKQVKVPVKEPYEVIVYKDNPDMSIRLYGADSTIEKGLNIGYDLTVRGYLQNIKLTYEDTRPETIKYITRTVETNKTHYIPPRGLYIGVETGLHLPMDGIEFVAPNVSLLLNKNMFTYSYLIGLDVHSIGVKRKLF